jgi:uncharacterized membrane protein
MEILADVAIFTRNGGILLSRWGHYLAGVTWIGLLYYFNFVQAPAFAELDAGSRTDAVSKLVPRALWWFRWGALLTVLFGISILGFQDEFNSEYFKSAPGISISTGILLALIMFANVWGIIWRNQKIVIASAQRVAAGGEADPAAAAAGRKGTLASRTNTLFSIPMLFFMGATSHFVGAAGFDASDSGHRGAYMGISFVIIALLELNALGVLGGTGPAPTRKYLETHRDTIIAGFVLTAILYILFDLFF